MHEIDIITLLFANVVSHYDGLIRAFIQTTKKDPIVTEVVDHVFSIVNAKCKISARKMTLKHLFFRCRCILITSQRPIPTALLAAFLKATFDIPRESAIKT